MSSFETPGEAPIAAGGGIDVSVSSDDDPYRALDDLMAAIEVLSPTWPPRDARARMDTMRL
ncbi:MAG TPA: hypothetical protein VGI14_12920 [Casimicrobiaceae bacterium]|jgi:hypothetical protein